MLNRLTRENNQKAGKTYVYTYANGNLTSRKTYAYTTGTLGAVQSTESYTYGKTAFHDRVTAFNGKTIAYTAGTGVMTGYGDYALTWFKIGLLGSYSKTGDTHTFTYDMDGRRLSRTDNGVTTTFVYAGDQLVGQTWGGNTLAFICNAAGEYVGFTYNGTNYYYVKNLQGDVVQIVNAAKTTVVKYYYDAWGYNFATEGSLASTVGAVNPIRYRGYYYDSGTGLYYLHSRYYNPELRRFISPDKLLDTQSLDGYNLFAYCGNNPVNGYDPFGFSVVDAAEGFLGGYGLAVGVSTLPVVPLLAKCIADLVSGAVDSLISFANRLIDDFLDNGNKIPTNDQTVYVLVYTEKDRLGEVGYVGRTNNIERRKTEHSRDLRKKGLSEPIPIITGLSTFEAQFCEQVYISVYTISCLRNRRHEISLGRLDFVYNTVKQYVSLQLSIAEDELYNLVSSR